MESQAARWTIAKKWKRLRNRRAFESKTRRIKTNNPVINLFLRCLSFHGLLDRLTRKTLSTRAYFILITSNLYAFHFISTIVYMSYRYGKIRIATVIYVFKTLYILYYVNASLHNGRLVSTCVNLFRDDRYNQFRHMWHVNCYQICFLLIGTSKIVQTLVIFLILRDEDRTKNYITYFLYDSEYLKSNINFGYVVVAVHIAVFEYFIYILSFFFQSTVVLAIQSLRCAVEKLADSLVNVNYDPRRVYERHTELFGTVQRLNRVLKWIFLCWVIDWTGTFYECCLNFKYSYPHFDWFFRMCYVTLVISLFVTLASASMLSESNAGLLKACHLRATQLTATRESQIIETFLLKQIRTGIFHFTFLNTVVLDKNFVGGLFLAVASYTTFIWTFTADEVQYDRTSNATTNSTN